MKSTGVWVFSGRPSRSRHLVTVVRVANGEILTTDRPFAEAREHLGGFYMIIADDLDAALNADDLDAALAWAARVTRCMGVPIEVRKFSDFADGPKG